MKNLFILRLFFIISFSFPFVIAANGDSDDKDAPKKSAQATPVKKKLVQQKLDFSPKPNVSAGATQATDDEDSGAAAASADPISPTETPQQKISKIVADCFEGLKRKEGYPVELNIYLFKREATSSFNHNNYVKSSPEKEEESEGEHEEELEEGTNLLQYEDKEVGGTQVGFLAKYKKPSDKPLPWRKMFIDMGYAERKEEGQEDRRPYLDGGILFFQLQETDNAEKRQDFVALLTYGEAHHMVNKKSSDFLEGVGFNALCSQGLLSGPCMKSASFEGMVTDNLRKDESCSRHPVTTAEMGMERPGQFLKGVKIKTGISSRQFEVTDSTIKFKIGKKNTELTQDSSESISSMIRICKGFIRLYLMEPKDKYLSDIFQKFPSLIDWQVKKAELSLQKKIKERPDDQILFLNWDVFKKKKVDSFTYGRKKYSYEPQLIQAFKEILKANPSISALGKFKVNYEKDIGDMEVMDALTIAPMQVDDNYYGILRNGKWVCIPADTIMIKRRFLRNRLLEQTVLDLINFDGSVHRTPIPKGGGFKESEAVYNQKAVEYMKSKNLTAFNLDLGQASLPKEDKPGLPKNTSTSKKPRLAKQKTGKGNNIANIEFADIIRYEAGTLYNIHVKCMGESWASSTLSHLFSQANVSAVVADQEFTRYFEVLEENKVRMNMEGIPDKDQKSINAKLKDGEMTFVIAIVEPEKTMKSSKYNTAREVLDDLPYFSVHNLHDVVTRIEQRGFPVKITIIQRDKAKKEDQAGSAGSVAASANREDSGIQTSSPASQKRKRDEEEDSENTEPQDE